MPTARRLYDLETVRTAAIARGWPEIFVHFGIPRELLDGNGHPCPKCGTGDNRLRLIRAVEGALRCNQCHPKKCGDGFAVLEWWLGITFPEAIRLVAEYLGVPPVDGKSAKPAARRASVAPAPKASSEAPAVDQEEAAVDPARDLVFEVDGHTEEALAAWSLFFLRKPGITPRCLAALGARVAKWKGRHVVFAIPARGVDPTAKPVGYALYNAATGGMLRVGPRWEKTVLTAGSKGAGWVGPLDDLAKSHTVWKVEGLSDLATILDAGLPEGHTALTNPCGASHMLAKELLGMLAGKTVFVVHDADVPGREGAANWTGRIFLHGNVTSVANVVLPYPVAETHGKDLRDWLNEGHGVPELLALAAAAPKEKGPPLDEPRDSPQRLARIVDHDPAFMPHLRYWRGERYVWIDGRREERPKSDFLGPLQVRIGKQFAQDYLDDLRDPEIKDVPPMRKTCATLTRAVDLELSGRLLVPSTVEWEMDLSLSPPAPRNWFTFRNGIIDLDNLVSDNPDLDRLMPHTPTWWSRSRTDYDYDPDAPIPMALKEIFKTSLDDDPQRIMQFQEWLGYLLWPDPFLNQLLLMYGHGANGKGVFMTIATVLVGKQSTCSIPLIQFDQGRHRFSLARTAGKRLNLDPEASVLAPEAEAGIKAFTGGGDIQGEKKGLEAFDFKPTAKLMIAANELPRFHDRTHGLRRRIAFLPMLNQIPWEKRNPNYVNQAWWLADRRASGLFNFAVPGLIRMLKRGAIIEPDKSKEILNEALNELDDLRAFIQSACEADAGGGLLIEDLEAACEAWRAKRLAAGRATAEFTRKKISNLLLDAVPGVTIDRPRVGGKQTKRYLGVTLRGEYRPKF